MPSLRIDQSDLKCKNGCDYFGNPQWHGYCSKCHREQMLKQRRAEKASSTSATLPRPEPRKPERGLKPHSPSFSKFEEKKLRQNETKAKANHLLKFNTLFKKSHSSTEEQQEQQPDKRPEFKIPPQVNEHMKSEFRVRFPRLGAAADRDARLFVHSFILDVIRCHAVMSVDELSERVQRQYQRFMKHMDTSPHFADVDSETKERLMDFVEKHAMSYLHDLPSIVFSPHGTEDERLDRAMSERIQQLGWVCERHLECKLDRASPDCRRLLYKAISELLGMDSATSPGGKLARVRRCCRHVVALCAPPASADDLLPALIFTVLKANPPRLTSNINFVTRFCNAQRLMTGEGGYYFTNLCCAVSFIENLNAESLNMDKKEFDCYMAMPASIGGSSWAAALSLCGAARDAECQREQVRELAERAERVRDQADKLAGDALTFQEQIAIKVQDLLTKTPLEIKPRRELPRIGNLKKLQSQPLVELGSSAEGPAPAPEENKKEQQKTIEVPQIQQVSSQSTTTEEEPKLNILGFEVIERDSPSKSPQNLDQWELKQTNSLELLTPSPLGFTPFDSRSIDELMTPDDFVTDSLAPGLSNINYDIDLSDLSGDNSIAEDAPKSQDPFSPDGLKKDFDPFTPQSSQREYKLDTFDEFSLLDARTNKQTDPFEIVHRSRDPFSPEAIKKEFDPFAPLNSNAAESSVTQSVLDKKVEFDPFAPLNSKSDADTFSESVSVDKKDEFDPFAPLNSNVNVEKSVSQSVDRKDASILDAGDSPTAACLLPSPLQPQSTGKPT